MQNANQKSLSLYGTCMLVAVLTWLCNWAPLVSQLNPVNVITHPCLEFIFLVNCHVNFSHYPCAWYIPVMQSSAVGTAELSVRVTCAGTLQEQIQLKHVSCYASSLEIYRQTLWLTDWLAAEINVQTLRLGTALSSFVSINTLCF